MTEIRELSFCDLRQKDIVSINDGRKLGKIIDLVFSPDGKVKGIVAPYGRKFLFFRSQEVYIPYINIKTIGEDIILVDIDVGLNQNNCRSYQISKDDRRGCNCKINDDKKDDVRNDCDGRCDKCMLFDCENRWRNRGNVYIDNAPYK